ncbi:MAG: phytanoyl-CoA dioxygenase family protein [Myxococcales bacterium]|nr:phytanoyl-CoA dioxygenase family protein [Myxococcales bacterium]
MPDVDPVDLRALRSDGYVHLSRIVPGELVARARAAIDADLSAHYDPRLHTRCDHRSYCPRLRGRAALRDLVLRSPVARVVSRLLGEGVSPDRGQVAIRWGREREAARPPEAHIDGFASGKNGLARGRVHSFTALVGVFLTPVTATFAGNFTVWPGSHEVYAAHFRRRRAAALAEPMPRPALDEPRQLLVQAGDVVVCNYLLGHTAADNVGPTDRLAVFFRYALADVDRRRLAYLSRPWMGWRLADAGPELTASSAARPRAPRRAYPPPRPSP